MLPVNDAGCYTFRTARENRRHLKGHEWPKR
jgi:hypothetical protein